MSSKFTVIGTDTKITFEWTALMDAKSRGIVFLH